MPHRICPGKELGDLSLFLAFSMILSTFEITKAKDEDGNEVETKFEFAPGVVRYVHATGSTTSQTK